MSPIIWLNFVIFIILWNFILSAEDFLEYYQPRSDFPKELNDWLSYVQVHRNDFRVIKNIIRKRKHQDYYDEKEVISKYLGDLDDLEEEETPQNDIFPHSNIVKKDKLYKSTISPLKYKQKPINPIRTRRNSAYFDHSKIEVDPKSKVGELKRLEEKYPDQIHKREIEIDILNDGKLLKSIKEKENNAKSIVLNIQNSNEDAPASTSTQKIDSNLELQPLYSPQRSVDSDNLKNKEAQTNFNNLFTVNENLNTDNSIIRDAFSNPALMYHVTLPNPNFILSDNTSDGLSNLSNFQNNNYQDMSKYWSDVEKNQMQQGIKFAQATGNIKQHLSNNKHKSSHGFEEVKTIVVEHIASVPYPNQQPEEEQHQIKRFLDASNDHFEDLLTQPEKFKDINIPTAFTQSYKNNMKKSNIIILPDEHVGEQNIPTAPQHFDQTVNNHISINVIHPQRDEDVEKDENYPLLVITIPEAERELVNEDCTADYQTNKEQPLKFEKFSNITKTTTNMFNEEIKNGLPCVSGERIDEIKDEMNNKFHVEPQRSKITNEDDNKNLRFEIKDNNNENTLSDGKEEIIPHFSDKFNNLFKEDLIQNENIEPCRGLKCDKIESYCEGSACRNNKFHKNKHKRKRRRRRRRKHRIIEDPISYQLRQLKAIDYAYDSDLQPPDIEESISLTSESTNQESAIEGDYGDEEDSVTYKNNGTEKLVKKVDDDFANPDTTEEPDDEEYYYEYDNKKQDEANVGPGRRQHKKSGKQQPTKERNKLQISIREPRSSDDNKSSANQKPEQKNKFPLSSKSFFTSNIPKRRESGDVSNILAGPGASIAGSGGPIPAPGAGPAPSIAPPADDKAISTDINLGGLDLSTPLEAKDSSVDDFGGGAGGGDVKEQPTTTASGECDTKVSVGPICETENFSKVKVTTMINFVAAGEVPGDVNNSLPSINEQYQNLEDILVGRLPISIVDSVFKHIKGHPTLKQRFFKGLKKKHTPVSFKNLPEISAKESNRLITLMSKIINRLQWTTTCQVLPNKLKSYLKSITSVNVVDRLSKTKEMEEINFEDNLNQTNFIFQSKIGTDSIEDKVRVLKNMLAKYQHLPDACKARAEPVKEYIENHLEMLSHVMPNSGESSARKNEPSKRTAADVARHEANKRNENENKDLIEQELESLGLGKHPKKYRPNFDLDTLLHSDASGSMAGKEPPKKTKKRNIKETSEEYDRLFEAIKKERIKREGRRRISEAFGKLGIDDYTGQNSDNAIDNVFENPLVFSF